MFVYDMKALKYNHINRAWCYLDEALMCNVRTKNNNNDMFDLINVVKLLEPQYVHIANRSSKNRRLQWLLILDIAGTDKMYLKK